MPSYWDDIARRDPIRGALDRVDEYLLRQQRIFDAANSRRPETAALDEALRHQDSAVTSALEAEGLRDPILDHWRSEIDRATARIEEAAGITTATRLLAEQASWTSRISDILDPYTGATGELRRASELARLGLTEILGPHLLESARDPRPESLLETGGSRLYGVLDEISRVGRWDTRLVSEAGIGILAHKSAFEDAIEAFDRIREMSDLFRGAGALVDFEMGIEAADSASGIEEQFAAFLDDLKPLLWQAHAAQVADSRWSRDEILALLSLLVAMASLLMQAIGSEKGVSQADVEAAVARQLSAHAPAQEKPLPPPIPETLYRVRREADVLEGPYPKAQLVDRLAAGEHVDVVKRMGHYAKVRYGDRLVAMSWEGWVRARSIRSMGIDHDRYRRGLQSGRRGVSSSE